MERWLAAERQPIWGQVEILAPYLPGERESNKPFAGRWVPLEGSVKNSLKSLLIISLQ